MASPSAESAHEIKPSWTFLSNHAHVLVCLARDPQLRLRDVSDQVGITERSVFKIVSELEEVGVIRRHRDGRRNNYEINRRIKLRHPLENDQTVGGLLAMLLEKGGRMSIKRTRRRMI